MAEYFVGLMSGTSMDGIDAAVVEFKSSSDLTVVATEFTPFPDALRAKIAFAARPNSTLLHNHDSPLHTELARHYADAVISLLTKSDLPASQITAVANHGQTVRHEPSAQPPFSIQLGDGQLIANSTGIKTVTQFRQADLAVGGQGAPLMPAFHAAIFNQTPQDNVFILNLGGIANISQLGAVPIGFDTGPSNCLLDQWIERHQGLRFDQQGRWAATGTVIPSVLERLLLDPYLLLASPKSTGTDYYNLDWLSTQIDDIDSYAANDIQATLMMFTVETIALALQQLGATTGNIYVCGGGANNSQLMHLLEKRLAEFTVSTTAKLGVPPDWVEAAGFAWLAYCYVHDIPSNMPSVTGASTAVVLGECFQPK